MSYTGKIEELIAERDALRQRVRAFESLETKRMKDAVTVEDWRRIAEHMEYQWRCCSEGFNRTCGELRQAIPEGWQPVPVEPFDAALNILKEVRDGKIGNCNAYREIIAAARKLDATP